MLLFLAQSASIDWLDRIALRYEESKLAFTEWTGISDAELHVHIGMVVFCLSMIILRKPVRSPWPLLITIIVEATNEFLGMRLTGSWNWPDTKYDIVYTLVWPCLLFFFARLRLIPQD